MQLIDIFGDSHNLSPGQQPVGIYDESITNYDSAVVTTPNGSIIDANGDLQSATFWTNEQLKETEKTLRKQFWKRIPKLKIDSAVSLPLYWSACYYHWMCDVLPRLSLLRQSCLKNELFLVPFPFKSWMIDSLHLLGIPKESCVSLKGKFAYKIKHLTFPDQLAMTGDHNPESLAWLRNQFRSKLKNRNETNNSKIYITRRFAESRRLKNESELIEKLKPLGFTVVAAESLPFTRQMEIFSEARVIVAPHGSGLSNSLVANQHCQIVEIFEPEVIRRCYATLARTLGFNHRCILGKTIRNENGEPNIHLETNSIEELCQYIRTL